MEISFFMDGGYRACVSICQQPWRDGRLLSVVRRSTQKHHSSAMTRNSHASELHQLDIAAVILAQGPCLPSCKCVNATSGGHEVEQRLRETQGPQRSHGSADMTELRARRALASVAESALRT